MAVSEGFRILAEDREVRNDTVGTEDREVRNDTLRVKNAPDRDGGRGR